MNAKQSGSFFNAKIISSTLRRATETAQEISQGTNIPMVGQEYNLREFYYRDYRLTDDLTKVPSDAESKVSFRERVVNAMNKVLKKYASSTLIIVSPQKVFECVRQALVGTVEEKLEPGGIYHFKKLQTE
ncbi:MAG: histidine phosphatase family protein [Bacteroidota bacterium]